MGLMITGQVTGVQERPVTTKSGDQFTARTAVVQDWGATFYVDLGRDVPTPEVGTMVAFDASVRAYPTKDGGAGYSYSARGRVAAAETALFAGSTS